MKRLTTAVFFLVITISLPAQSGLLKKAGKLMDALDFQGAIELLENGKGKKYADQRAALLGECYRRSGLFEEAEARFGQVADWSAVQPQYLLHSARTLQRVEKYPEAQAHFERYLGRVPGDLLAKEQMKACKNIRALQERGMGWWEAQPLQINSGFREFCPAIYDKGLVFCSDRPVEGLANYEDAWTGEGFLDLFLVSRKVLDSSLCGSYTYGDPKIFNPALSSRYHEASAQFSIDFGEIYFTSNAPGDGKGRDDEGLLRLQIQHARRLPGNRGWTDPRPMPINSEEYSVMHPCLSPDGKRLFFASDMPGGYGGLDLYYVEMIDGVWSPPFNLGSGINTQGSEAFPYLGPGGSLYFSSDGWAGLGGLDIFYTIPARGGWEIPYNPGAPLNSAADDFGFVWEEPMQCGYLSSDRRGGAGKDDLYVFRKISHPIHLEIRDAGTQAFLGGGFLTAGCRGDTLKVLDGQARWEIPHNTCCELKAEVPDYIPAIATRCTYNMGPGESLQLTLPLTPNPVYLLEGVVFLESTGLPMEEVTVEAFDRNTGKVVAVYRTNFSGRFEMEVEGGICYQVRAAKSGFPSEIVAGPCVPGQGSSQTFQVKVYMEKY